LHLHCEFVLTACVDAKNAESGCSADTATIIRSTIYGSQKVIEGLKILVGTMKDAREFGCQAVPGAPIPLVGFSDIGKVICTAAVASIKIPLQIALDIATIAADVADRAYNEKCEPNGAVWETNYQEIRQDAIYNNVITNARNIITTFAATQQLKVMLGDVQAGLEADREERDDQGRRLQSDDCVDTPRGFLTAPCSEVTCQDPARLCDGSYNYPYISGLVTGK